MLRLVKSLVLSVVLISIVSLTINIQSIYQQHRIIKKVAKTMVTYAQKNGGFVKSITKDGKEVRDPETFLIELIKENGLEENIPYEEDRTVVEFVPGLYKQVNKKEMFEIVIKEPKIIVIIPFKGKVEWKLNDIHDYGYSHKYFK